MADYHQYVIDVKGRKILGDFDGAYRNCNDVWPGQHDINAMKFRIVRSTGLFSQSYSP